MNNQLLNNIKNGKHLLPETSEESCKESEKYPIKIPTLTEVKQKQKQYKEQSNEAAKEFGNSRICQRFKFEDNKDYTILQKDGWELRYFNIRPGDTSDYILFRTKDVENTPSHDSIPVIEFNCDNNTLKFNSYSIMHKNHDIPVEVQNIVKEFCSNPVYSSTKIEIVPTSYLKLYIAVLDEVNDGMVPTLVAHSMLGAHLEFQNPLGMKPDDESMTDYDKWLHQSFRKCVVKVNRKEFEKIKKLEKVYLGHENTTLNGEKSCAVVYPVWSDKIPNVLKFSKLWKPLVI